MGVHRHRCRSYQDDVIEIDMYDLHDSSRPTESGDLSFREIPPSERQHIQPGTVLYWSIGYEQDNSGTYRRVSEFRRKRMPRVTSQMERHFHKRATDFADSFGIPQNFAPTPQTTEVSLFGPGVGESIVVHLGQGQWVIIDSCINQSTGNPVALDYLRGLGVDVASEVVLVVATHWHDDHIGGLSQIVTEATSAKFACSAALSNKEFMQLLTASGQVKLTKADSGLKEFRETFETINRTKNLRKMTGPDIWAADGMILFENSSQMIAIRSLSPSAHVITSAIGRFADMIPNRGSQLSRFQSFQPNDLSIVLQIRIGTQTLLLGGDLEIGSNDHCGWRGVLLSTNHGNRSSIGYKVAHHGSVGADHDDIWTTLIDNDGVAMLTPFGKGKKPLPAPEDVTRINQRISRAFTTAWPPKLRPQRRRPLEREISQVVRNRSTVRDVPGHIRLRLDQSPQTAVPKIDLFAGATMLTPATA